MVIYCTSHLVEKWHKKFDELLVRDLIVQSHEANITVSGVSGGMPSSSGAQLSWLEVKYSQHWPSKWKRRCRVCSLNRKTRSTLSCCKLICWSVCRGLLWEVAYASQSVNTEWTYHKLWSDAVCTCIQSEQKFIVYSVIKSTCLKFQDKTTGKSFGML
jgi:hypothetical protein